MPRPLALALVLVVSFAAACSGDPAGATEKVNTCTVDSYGFSIDLPVVTESPPANQIVLTFTLPPVSGFAPNVNVVRQKYPDSLKSYDALSRQELERASFEIIHATLDGDRLVYEYRGTMQGRNLHFYARAMKVGDFVLLATATCPESSWKDLGDVLRASIDSLAPRS